MENKTWKPTTAGILSIIAGSLVVIAGILLLVMGGTFACIFSDPSLQIPPMVGSSIMSILTVAAIPIIVLGAVSIVGGIYSLKRRLWGLALAGAICALVPYLVLGILAIIFVSLGKDEFTSGSPQPQLPESQE
ncbi:MAG: hypothetical protein J7K94_05630 [Dehalococcoidia bacterium]|nr:hypothetical protein [Dehalococcoidia bacterium]